MNTPLMVTIRCMVYNHEPYIRECLEGFVMQKTNFRFEAIVHDDASTDGSAAIIREYAEKYPDIIKPIYQTENQYSKRDGSLRRILNEHTHGKYVALCEGDDYWIDPLKLQKQVDFLEANEEYSMCFHADKQLKPNGEFILHRPRPIKQEYTMEDVILGGGGFMATNSMVYKAELATENPEWRANAPVGDLPLMLLLATKGKIGYINETMSVYRILASGSWSERMLSSRENRKKHIASVVRMLNEFDQWTSSKYSRSIHNRIKKIKRLHHEGEIRIFICGFFLSVKKIMK